MENRFYLVLFVDKNDNYIAIESYGNNKRYIKDVMRSKIRKEYGDEYIVHSIRELKEPTKFIYIEDNKSIDK